MGVKNVPLNVLGLRCASRLNSEGKSKSFMTDGDSDSNWNTNPIFLGSPIGGESGRPQSASEAFQGNASRAFQNPAFFPLESTVFDEAAEPTHRGEGPKVPVESLTGGREEVGEVDTSGRPSQPVPAYAAQAQVPLYETNSSLQANQTRIKSSLGADHPEESRFEEIIRRLFTHEISLSEGIKSFRDVAVLRGRQLRELATASGDPSSPIYAKLMKDAEELHCEGMTWSLLYYLFAHSRDADGYDMSYPAGMGGYFVKGAGMQKTLRQHAVDLVYQDDALNRAARVVTWLEEERGRYDADPAQGLGRKDGVWKETRMGLEGNHTDDTLVRQLDPDGMIREDGALHRDNAKDEERLSKVLWRLIRSGRLHQASQVCHYVGQPWRAASLTGYGKYGPLPLGDAADEADENEGGAPQMNEETLAGEIECAKSTMEGQNKVLWRFACYNAACAIADRVEGAGHGRFESAIYGVLSGDMEHAMMACTNWEDALWVVMRCWLEYQIDTELLGGDGMMDGIEGGDRENSEKGTYAMDEMNEEEDGMNDVDATAFPIEAVAEQMPEDLPSAVLKGAAEFGGIESTDRTKRFRKVQVNLILGELEPLVDALKRWIVPGGSTEEAQDCPPGLMRFSAHLALLLWRLNLVKIVDDEGRLLMDSMNDGLQKLVWIYVIHLIDSASYELVPTYVVHLRKGLRRTTMQLLLEEATYNERVEVRKKVRSRCDGWLDNYIGVEGIEPGEMWASIQTFCQKSLRSTFGGPLTRADSLSWMFFDEKNRADATIAAEMLCRDLALAGIRGALAGLHLLREVIPPSIGEAQFADSPAFGGWETYFEVVREAAVWQNVFSQAAAEFQAHPGNPAYEEALKALSSDTFILFEGIINFVEQGFAWMDGQADPSRADAAGEGPMEATLVVGPAASAESGSIDDPSSYPEFTHSELQATIETLEGMCRAAAETSTSPLDFAVGTGDIAPPGCDLPGLVCIKVWASPGGSRDAFETSVISLFCGVLKNEELDLNATNIMSSSTVSSAICKAIVTTTLVMHIAEIRRALAFIGDCGPSPAMNVAEALIEATKMQGIGGGDGLWSEEEMKLLCELEQHAKSLMGV